MLPNAFIGRPNAPTEEELTTALGAVRTLWDELLAELALPIQEWHSYSIKAGWSLKLKLGKRTIVYLTPCAGAIRVAFVLGDKAMKAARECRLPARVVKMLDEAPRYPEGNGVRMEITQRRELAAVKKLAAVKMAN
jgi:hypothetical protein